MLPKLHAENIRRVLTHTNHTSHHFSHPNLQCKPVVYRETSPRTPSVFSRSQNGTGKTGSLRGSSSLNPVIILRIALRAKVSFFKFSRHLPLGVYSFQIGRRIIKRPSSTLKTSPMAALPTSEPAAELEKLSISKHGSEKDSELIDELLALSKKNPKLVRSTEYTAPADPNINVRSWKMNEFKYYDVPSPFPTLARGLFTQDVQTNDRVKHRIVARGYDKFFNIGEVPWTTWASLESHTGAPYILTLKSNGCIIFIAALTPDKLLITSKHALGPSNNAEYKSHAQFGERWLRKHLLDAGKTEEQLAATLWEKNWTAVAELCDDSFEEHVLPYGPEKTGLHLHGLNKCTRQFKTMDQPVVDAFAKEWGFIQTLSTVLDTVPQVREFTEAIGRTGKWNGEALEGFVVRTRVVDPPTKGGQPAAASPYRAGSSFFFKVKFDEPYMMYRDWREVTKTLLSKGPSMGNVPKSKLRRPETRVYINWVIGEIKRDREQFATYTHGKGIIATRERFLNWLRSEEGSKAVKRQDELPAERGLIREGEKFGKTIIAPIAVPGVGKTSIAVALSHLFGFGHIQSDDIKAKKAAPIFIKNVVNALKTNDVVIADKNNHLIQHRQQLREAVRTFKPPVRLMALNWSFDQPLSTIHRICGDRVLQRGENHQSLHGDPLAKSHEDVIWQFMNQAEELADEEVDVAVEMDWEETLEDALTRAVDACVRILGVPRPDQEKVGEALAIARGYAPSTKANKADSAKAKKQAVRYYAILAEVDLQDVLGKRFAEADVPGGGKAFWENLKAQKRVAPRPHITLVHQKALPGETVLWERCKELHLHSNPPLFSFRLSNIVWNDRVMAATVADFAVSTDDSHQDEKGLDFILKLPFEVQNRLHVTVGTRDGVPPVEAKTLVETWKKNKHLSGVGSLELDNVWVKGSDDGSGVVPAPAGEAPEPAPITDQEVGEYREQDRFLPIANVSRIMKAAVPGTAKISKEAKECVQECVSEFISFITSEAAEKCQMEKRKTIGGEDILYGMVTLGFENYAETLKIHLAKLRQHQTSAGNDKPRGGEASGNATATEDQ
ncbi:predicted protein [Postia placenta Mad-698-R]|uniref:Transcription factor CBF/NF-Y/archaeal histone domain-containing protein n=1 Tax=Postia placenta MAD-698-R-SB12 TaxID=670580 RepID=A0A1X6N5D8_9APHY|nr:hypothetical protein POSPLADRAFT_1065790 [Postia placenta MAD-698-R-SB12]EED78500.1 predicted protein [Postia placenta Mad-698-R]OSX63740.1 hypothetical protein POSPLADRAFT_1065790 [Postia placenta MAD-698-R-SB12]